jgi:hypothetical protein
MTTPHPEEGLIVSNVTVSLESVRDNSYVVPPPEGTSSRSAESMDTDLPPLPPSPTTSNEQFSVLSPSGSSSMGRAHAVLQEGNDSVLGDDVSPSRRSSSPSLRSADDSTDSSSETISQPSSPTRTPTRPPPPPLPTESAEQGLQFISEGSSSQKDGTSDVRAASPSSGDKQLQTTMNTSRVESPHRGASPLLVVPSSPTESLQSYWTAASASKSSLVD